MNITYRVLRIPDKFIRYNIKYNLFYSYLPSAAEQLLSL